MEKNDDSTHVLDIMQKSVAVKHSLKYGHNTKLLEIFSTFFF